MLQFAAADYLGNRVWRLSGLLRGRAGTEEFAAGGHDAGTLATLINDRLTAIDSAQVSASVSSRIAAIGRGDQVPVYADLQNAGLSRRPLTPVHPRLQLDQALTLTVCWTRRARGRWLWEDRVDVPLIEEQERYLVGFGPVDQPFVTWETLTPEIQFSSNERAALVSEHGNGPVWVRQIGTFDQSSALHLTDFS